MELIKKGVFFVIILIIFISCVNAVSKLSVNANIPDRYKEIFIGESVMVEIDIILIDHDIDEVVDILIEYSIEDIDGNIIYKLLETKGGILRISDVKEISIPNDVKPGLYVVEVKATCEYGLVSKTSETFEVVKKPSISFFSYFLKDKAFCIIVVIFLITYLKIIYDLFKIKKHIHYKVNGGILFKEKLIKRR